MGRSSEAIAMAQEGVAHAERAVRASHPGAKDLLARAVFQAAMAVHPTDASVPHWHRAETLFAELLAEQPDDPVRQRNLGLVDKYLGSVLDRQGKNDEAAARYERALELDERRLARTPDDRQTQFDTAISLANLATIARDRDDEDKAVALFTRSLKIRSDLSDSDPDDVLARGRVAWVRTRLAALELERGNLSAALDHAETSVRDQQRVVDKTKDERSAADLGSALVTLADVEIARGRKPAACSSLGRAISLLEAAPKDQTAADLERARKALKSLCGG
jgi:tetratricopeptide (TPR) repeat protein